MIVAAALVQQPAARPSEAARSCVIEQSVQLGRGNTEDSANVVRAAWSRCSEHVTGIYQEARASALVERYAGNALPQGHTPRSDVQLIETIERRITDAAILAVLEARGAGQS